MKILALFCFVGLLNTAYSFSILNFLNGLLKPSCPKEAPKCPPLNPMPNFNQSRIYGNWYARMIALPFVLSPGNRCFTNNLVKINDTTYIQLQSWIGENNATMFNNVTDSLTNTPGYVYEAEIGLVRGPSIFVYTDYENILAKYACTIVNVNATYSYKQEYFYIATRSRSFSNTNLLLYTLNQLKSSIPGIDLTKLQFDLINDSTCTNSYIGA